MGHNDAAIIQRTGHSAVETLRNYLHLQGAEGIKMQRSLMGLRNDVTGDVDEDAKFAADMDRLRACDPFSRSYDPEIANPCFKALECPVVSDSTVQFAPKTDVLSGVQSDPLFVGGCSTAQVGQSTEAAALGANIPGSDACVTGSGHVFAPAP